MVNMPAGLEGWAVFFMGLLIIAYRVHGIDAPRAWIEWVDHQFSNIMNFRIIGGAFFVVGFLLFKYGTFYNSLIGVLFVLTITSLLALGLTMAASPNHIRHLVVATAEADDKIIRFVSIGIVVLGLLWALAPWFFTAAPSTP